MNEFDRLSYIARLQELFGERGQKLTEEQVMARGKRLARKRGWSMEQAFDAIEDGLLSHNPSPENYDVE